jgi:hypothetical protein
MATDGLIGMNSIDSVEAHFRKIEFSHSLALHPTAYSLRFERYAPVAPASGGG